MVKTTEFGLKLQDIMRQKNQHKMRHGATLKITKQYKKVSFQFHFSSQIKKKHLGGGGGWGENTQIHIKIKIKFFNTKYNQ